MAADAFETREARHLEVDGKKLFCMLHLPIGRSPVPGVVVSHGFAGNKIGSRRLYVLQAESLARSGIAAFRFDFRGCGDSEGHFHDVSVEGLVDDGLEVLRFMRTHPQICPDRIGLLGASLGGTISVLLAEKERSIKSLSLWAAVANGKQWQIDWKRLHPEEIVDTKIRCTGEMAGKAFRRQFLATRADRILALLPRLPVMHVQGGQDQIVLPSHREAFLSARQAATGLSHFVILPNSCHHFQHQEERESLIQQTTDWFRKTLI